MGIEGYRWVRALVPEHLATQCDTYRTQHRLSWDGLVVAALLARVDGPKAAKKSEEKRKVEATVNPTPSTDTTDIDGLIDEIGAAQGAPR
jgi:hypothetical protein